MAEAQLRQFLEKVRQLNAFVALSEADPALRQQLQGCEHHDEVVALARRCGFEIGRRWGEPLPPAAQPSSRPQNPSAAPSDVAAALTQPGAVAVASLTRAASGGSAGCASEGLGPLPAAAHERVDWPIEASQLLTRQDGLSSLLAGPCPPAGQEQSDLLLQTPGWRLERIHSCAYRSPDGFWYEQQEDEWVLLLQGTARLRFADQPSDLALRSGDSLTIRAGRRHRVVATDPAPGTIWLALFWPPA